MQGQGLSEKMCWWSILLSTPLYKLNTFDFEIIHIKYIGWVKQTALLIFKPIETVKLFVVQCNFWEPYSMFMRRKMSEETNRDQDIVVLVLGVILKPHSYIERIVEI